MDISYDFILLKQYSHMSLDQSFMYFRITNMQSKRSKKSEILRDLISKIMLGDGEKTTKDGAMVNITSLAEQIKMCYNKKNIDESNYLQFKLKKAFLAKEYLSKIVSEGADPIEMNWQIADLFQYNRMRAQEKLRHQNFIRTVPDRALVDNNKRKKINTPKCTDDDDPYIDVEV